jgi:hypothetical protein
VNYQDISPQQLQNLLASNWEVVGFQPTITPADAGEASTTDGSWILLKRGSSLAILSQGFSGPDFYMQILFLTGESL